MALYNGVVVFVVSYLLPQYWLPINDKAKCHCMSMHAFQGLRNAIGLGRKVSDTRIRQSKMLLGKRESIGLIF